MGRTCWFHCQGPSFDPLSKTKIPQALGHTPAPKKEFLGFVNWSEYSLKLPKSRFKASPQYRQGGFPGGTSGEEPTYQPETQDPWVRKIPLEEKIATHSSVSAWRAPWTEEPGELQSTGSQSRTWLSNWARSHTQYKQRQVSITSCLKTKLL